MDKKIEELQDAANVEDNNYQELQADIESKADQEQKAEPLKNPKELLYDKIPLSYKTVDIITKILIAAFIIVLIYLLVLGGGRT